MSQQHESNGPRMEFDLHFRPGLQGRRELADGPAPDPPAGQEAVPRVTRLLALAHRWNNLLERGEVQNQAEIARLMGITEARVSQIMNLTFLAAAIQEDIMRGTAHPKLTESILRKALQSPVWGYHLSSVGPRASQHG